MNEKILFQEALASLVEFASTNSNKVTSKDVHLYFQDLNVDESGYQFIYDYLALNKIQIEDVSVTPGDVEYFKKITDNDNFDAHSDDSADKKIHDGRHDNTSAAKDLENGENHKIISGDSAGNPLKKHETEQELAFIQMYMDELSEIVPAKDSEVSTLIEKLTAGDLSVVNRLVELHLNLTAQTAQNYRGQGVTFGDLIQEGNVGLMLGISEYNPACGDFNSYIRERINSAMKSCVDEQINSDRIGNRLADKLNRLDSATKKLSQKLGRVPDIAELAEEMGISKDETSLLLKTSLDTLSVNEDAGTKDSL